MRGGRVVLSIALLIAALFVNMNAELVDSWADRPVAVQQDQDYELMTIQSTEEWLVLQVEFPDNPYSTSKAAGLLEGDGSAEQYIEQMTNGMTTLEVTLYEEVWTAPHNVKRWGEDIEGEHDSSADGSGAEELVRDVVLDLLSGEDLSRWDIDGDGVIDRLLLLHSAQPQESGGNSNSLWSHFSGMQESLEIGEWTIEHYTIASVDAGLGTVVHEMLHQMGALDLYDVHSELPSNNWNGIGDWGIMASGNWNDGGDTPAMPSAATMALIGVDREVHIDASMDETHQLLPITEGGYSLRIEIAPDEWILVTHRGDSGFDSALPGHGLLVEQQDRNNGDEANNLVNTDPDTAWVKVIEADGDAAMARGRDSGAPGDVFSEDSKFGAEGMIIRDSRGRLVSWTATVTFLSAESATIFFDFPETAPSIELLPPRGPLEIITGEAVHATVTAKSSCDLEIDIRSSSSSAESSPRVIPIPAGESIVPILQATEMTDDLGNLRGTVGCAGETAFDIDLDWYVIGHRFYTDPLEEVIAWDETSTIFLSPSCFGSGPRTYSIVVEGAASRIASVRTQGELAACSEIQLDIDPDGLLTPGMVANGELIFVDQFGLEQRIPLVLTAQSSFNGDSPLAWLNHPSNSIMIILLLVAISVVSGGHRSATVTQGNPDVAADEPPQQWPD